MNNKEYKQVPRIFINLFENINSIIEILANTSAIELAGRWNKKTNENNKVTDWIEIVSASSKSVRGAKHLALKKKLTELVFQ
ncbi:hypothetical protein [Maribacter sp. ACAM166]|uniref:hypothetical protein n=1 Tax=Maribacter sp. ACAM166 TaxID=2508996 RepID=UPI001BB20455|nr:hypothetical protein [Maribacter sp. ACAM166]